MFVYNALLVASVLVVRSSAHNALLDHMNAITSVCHANQAMSPMLLELPPVICANKAPSPSRVTLLVVLALLDDSVQALAHRLAKLALSDLCSQTPVLLHARSVVAEGSTT
jgi:hypothetical protein